MNKIIRYFPNTHLGNSHTGLKAIAKEHGVNLDQLSPGEFVVFTNRAKTGVKIFTRGNTLSYTRAPGSERLDLETIRLIPTYFQGGAFQYDQALKNRLLKSLKAA